MSRPRRIISFSRAISRGMTWWIVPSLVATRCKVSFADWNCSSLSAFGRPSKAVMIEFRALTASTSRRPASPNVSSNAGQRSPTRADKDRASAASRASWMSPNMLNPLDFAGDRLQGEALLGRAEFDRNPRHPEHHATFLVLRDGGGAGAAHLEQPVRAVIAHAGQDDPEGVRARMHGRRAEQHVDGRAVPADRRAVLDGHGVGGAAPLQEQVMISGCYQHSAG